MRFKIGDTTYNAATLDRISLSNILLLEKETTEYGRPMKWSEIRAMAQVVEQLDPKEFENHDEAPWFIALTVWASRLDAGEKITFAQAIDFPLGDLELIPDPQDHKKAANPTRARPASGRAGARAAKKSAPRKKASAKQ